MSLRTIGLTLGFVIGLLSAPSFADMFAPSHSCSKPYKPYQFSSRSERDLFLLEVQNFKECISDFVEEQEAAIRRHREAANEAIDEWNSFVNYELR